MKKRNGKPDRISKSEVFCVAADKRFLPSGGGNFESRDEKISCEADCEYPFDNRMYKAGKKCLHSG